MGVPPRVQVGLGGVGWFSLGGEGWVVRRDRKSPTNFLEGLL